MLLSHSTPSSFLLGSTGNTAEPSCRPTYNSSFFTPKSCDHAMMMKNMETNKQKAEQRPEKGGESWSGSCISTDLRLFDDSWAAINCAPSNSSAKKRKLESVKVRPLADKPLVSTELRLFEESWLTKKKKKGLVLPPAAVTTETKKRSHGLSGKETEIGGDYSEILSSSIVSCVCSSKEKKARTSEAISSTPNAGGPSVSTKLVLFDESWFTSNTVIPSISLRTTESDHTRKPGGAEEGKRVGLVLPNIRSSRTNDLEDGSHGASAKLKMFEDPWKIKKKLTSSDLGNLCRLLVASNMIKTHVLPCMNDEITNQIETGKGAPVSVWDADTRSVHKLVFKKWPTSKSYVFIEGWTQEFVRRRGLKEGDEVGLHWDIYNSRFNFCVSSRN